MKSVQVFVFETLIHEKLPNDIIVVKRCVVLLPSSGHTIKHLLVPPA